MKLARRVALAVAQPGPVLAGGPFSEHLGCSMLQDGDEGTGNMAGTLLCFLNCVVAVALQLEGVVYDMCLLAS